MSRLLFVWIALASSVSAQTLESLYGTWEIARAQTAETRASTLTTVVYEVVELSDGFIVHTLVADSPGFGRTSAYSASAASYRYESDGLALTTDDTTRVELALVGERLRMTWRSPDALLAETLYDRTGARRTSDAVLGTWLAPVVDVGIAFEVPMRIVRAGEGREPGSLSVLGDFVLTRESVTFQEGDPLADIAFYSAAPYTLSADGRTLTVHRTPPERWFRPQ